MLSRFTFDEQKKVHKVNYFFLSMRESMNMIKKKIFWVWKKIHIPLKYFFPLIVLNFLMTDSMVSFLNFTAFFVSFSGSMTILSNSFFTALQPKLLMILKILCLIHYTFTVLNYFFSCFKKNFIAQSCSLNSLSFSGFPILWRKKNLTFFGICLV